MPVIPLVAATLEPVTVVISTPLDPTGTPPEFTIAVDANGQPTGWANGSWDGAWSSTNGGRAKAVSPLIGASPGVGGITVTDETFSLLFMRWTRGGAKPVRRVCWLDVT